MRVSALRRDVVASSGSRTRKNVARKHVVVVASVASSSKSSSLRCSSLSSRQRNVDDRGAAFETKASDDEAIQQQTMADVGGNALNLTDIASSCSIDEPENCTVAELEILYVDALWNYYNDGTFTLTDAQYDQIREELNWQGSGFPTLRREEITFVQAALAYSRGEKIMPDEEYEQLKTRIKSEKGKRKDVTALLLYTKGNQLLDKEQFDLMSEEMEKLGIDVGMKGATCTLSQTPTELKRDYKAVLKMYSALAIAPFLIGLSPTLFFDFIVGWHVPNGLGLGFAATLAIILTAKLTEYTELNNAQILTGQCPCCETPFKQIFSGPEGGEKEVEHKCKVCATTCSLSREQKKIVKSGGFSAA